MLSCMMPACCTAAAQTRATDGSAKGKVATHPAKWGVARRRWRTVLPASGGRCLGYQPRRRMVPTREATPTSDPGTERGIVFLTSAVGQCEPWINGDDVCWQHW